MKASATVAGAIILWCRLAAFGAPPAGVNIDVTVLDPANQPLGGVLVKLITGNTMAGEAETDPKGQVKLSALKEGYLEYLAPVGKGLQINVGQFVTPSGAEVIVSKDNWEYTRCFQL